MSRKTNNDTHPTKLFNEKISFIEKNFPEFKTCDPYQDYYFIEKVKTAMIDAGLYRQKYARSNPNINAAVINLIKRAKGEKITKRLPERK